MTNVMHDQADHLRRLMHGARFAPAGSDAPQLIAVAGAKGGVGTTTIAANLAVAMAKIGRRTVLVDGDLGRADAAALCGLRDGPTIVDVLAGRRPAEGALQQGPAGIRVLSGAWATGHLTDCNASAQERLIAELTSLANVDAVIIDAGCGMDRVLQRFWTAADQVLLVTTPDDASVMNAYSAVKTMACGKSAEQIHALVNQAGRYDDARDAYLRLSHACRRFLAVDLTCAAHIMTSAEVTTAGARRTPFVLCAPVCQASQSCMQIAQFFGQTTLAPRTSDETSQQSRVIAPRSARQITQEEIEQKIDQTIQAAYA